MFKHTLAMVFLFSLVACTTTKYVVVEKDAYERIVETRGALRAQDSSLIGPSQNPQMMQEVERTVEVQETVTPAPTTTTVVAPAGSTVSVGTVTPVTPAPQIQVQTSAPSEPGIKLHLPLEPKTTTTRTTTTMVVSEPQVNPVWDAQTSRALEFDDNEFRYAELGVEAQEQQDRHAENMTELQYEHQENVQRLQNQRMETYYRAEDRERDDALRQRRQDQEHAEDVLDEMGDIGRDFLRYKAQMQEQQVQIINRVPRDANRQDWRKLESKPKSKPATVSAPARTVSKAPEKKVDRPKAPVRTVTERERTPRPQRTVRNH